MAEGSEHTVYKETIEDGVLAEVLKVTHIGMYGDYYAVLGAVYLAICVHPGTVSQADGIAGRFRPPHNARRGH
jgi:hypothetical protein